MGCEFGDIKNLSYQELNMIKAEYTVQLTDALKRGDTKSALYCFAGRLICSAEAAKRRDAVVIDERLFRAKVKEGQLATV